MAFPEAVSDDEVQEYIDGRLRGERKMAVESYLAKNPEKAAEVQSLMRQQQALRKLGEDILQEPIPERLQEVLRRMQARRNGG